MSIHGELPGREGTGEPAQPAVRSLCASCGSRTEDTNRRRGRDGMGLVRDTGDQRFAGGMNWKVGAGAVHAQSGVKRAHTGTGHRVLKGALEST